MKAAFRTTNADQHQCESSQPGQQPAAKLCCLPSAYQEKRTEKKSHSLSLPCIYLYLLLFASLQTINEIQSEAQGPHFGQQLGPEQHRRKERTNAVLPFITSGMTNEWAGKWGLDTNSNKDSGFLILLHSLSNNNNTHWQEIYLH